MKELEALYEWCPIGCVEEVFYLACLGYEYQLDAPMTYTDVATTVLGRFKGAGIEVPELVVNNVKDLDLD